MVGLSFIHRWQKSGIFGGPKKGPFFPGGAVQGSVRVEAEEEGFSCFSFAGLGIY